jgi:hypothetical protein
MWPSLKYVVPPVPPLRDVDEVLPLLAATPCRRLAEVNVEGGRGLANKAELLLVPPFVVAVLDLDRHRLGNAMLLIDVVGDDCPASALRSPLVVVALELHDRPEANLGEGFRSATTPSIVPWRRQHGATPAGPASQGRLHLNVGKSATQSKS